MAFLQKDPVFRLHVLVKLPCPGNVQACCTPWSCRQQCSVLSGEEHEEAPLVEALAYSWWDVDPKEFAGVKPSRTLAFLQRSDP